MSGENIEEIFNKITQTLIYKIDSGEIPEDLVVSKKQVTQLSSNGVGDTVDGKNASSCNC